MDTRIDLMTTVPAFAPGAEPRRRFEVSMWLSGRIFAFALASALAMPVATAGQAKRGHALIRIEPKEIPSMVASGELPIFHVFEIGCPSDNEWVAASLDALEEAGRTDSLVGMPLAASFGVRILSGDMCPADLSRFETWIADRLNKFWRDGVLGDEESDTMSYPFFLFGYIGLSSDSVSQALTRGIAMDTTVTSRWRDQAARTMVSQRYGEDVSGRDPSTDPRYGDALQSVVTDLSASPHPPRFVVQVQESARMASEGRNRRPPIRMIQSADTCKREPARMLTDDRRLSDLIKSHYPPGAADLGIGGTTHLQLELDEEGRITDAKVTRSSGNRGIDRAAMQVARRVRFAPARRCGAPRAAGFALWLRFVP